MPRRSISVWFVLAVFTVGGLVAPSLHRVQHGLERLSEPVTCHSPAVHDADLPQWTEESVAADALDCTFCTARLLVVPSPPGASVVPVTPSTPAVETTSHLTAASVFADRTIRGPPSS